MTLPGGAVTMNDARAAPRRHRRGSRADARRPANRAARPRSTSSAEAADGTAGWETIARERPDVAVIDIGLPGIDGVTLTKRVRAELPQTHVVIVTMIDFEDEVLAALAAGADAYCLKSSEPERIVDAVRIASEGGAYFDPQHRARRAGALLDGATDRRSPVAAHAARDRDPAA